MFSTGFNSGDFGGSNNDGEVFRYFEFTSGVPPCSVHEHDCVSFCVNLFADFVEVQLHGLGISSWQDQSSTYTTLWADGPEQVGVFVALISREARSCPLPCPNTSSPILLTDPRFILKPQFYLFALG